MAILTINNAACNIVPEVINYGLLYNWPITEGTDDDSLTSSDDWNVPTSIQSIALDAYISDDGGGLKEVGLTHWLTPNTGATNVYGFNGRGAGKRKDDTGVFFGIKSDLRFWMSDEFNEFFGKYSSLTALADTFFQGPATEKAYGNSIRLVSDATGIADGETTIYTGNDGKYYTGIVINELYWLADNLVETKLRDGSWIMGFDGGVYTPIANLTWAGLSTGALCAYDDDTDNV